MQFNLTPKQRQLLKYIDYHTALNGAAPSYDEMKDALGLASKSGIHRLITALEERGAIRRLPNKARSITVIAKIDKKHEAREMLGLDGACTVPFLGTISDINRELAKGD